MSSKKSIEKLQVSSNSTNESNKNSQNKKRKEKLYEVQSILNKKYKQGKIYYLVKWKGYSESESTWEPKKNLHGVNNMIQKYEENKIKLSKNSKKISKISPKKRIIITPSKNNNNHNKFKTPNKNEVKYIGSFEIDSPSEIIGHSRLDNKLYFEVAWNNHSSNDVTAYPRLYRAGEIKKHDPLLLLNYYEKNAKLL